MSSSILTKAVRVQIKLGDIPLDVYQLPDGSYKLAGKQITDAIEEPNNSLYRKLGVKSSKELPNVIVIRHERGGDMTLIPIDIAIQFWSICFKDKRNQKAAMLITEINKRPELVGLPDNFYFHVSLPRQLNRQLEKKGVIYILEDKGNKAYKIGFTKNLANRLKKHSGSNPFLTMVCFYKNQTINDEQNLHDLLSQYRIKDTAEWYHSDENVIAIINSFFFGRAKSVYTSEGDKKLEPLLCKG